FPTRAAPPPVAPQGYTPAPAAYRLRFSSHSTPRDHFRTGGDVMQYTDERYHLHVEIRTQDCDLPADERTRMQQSLEPLGQAVTEFPRADLWLKVIRHPGSDSPYHVEAKLALPGQPFFSGDWDAYLDSAFQRCVRKLARKV